MTGQRVRPALTVVSPRGTNFATCLIARRSDLGTKIQSLAREGKTPKKAA
jgi:hypothetical protein